MIFFSNTVFSIGCASLSGQHLIFSNIGYLAMVFLEKFSNANNCEIMLKDLLTSN